MTRCNAPARWLALYNGFQACSKHKREQPKRNVSGVLIEWERFEVLGGAVCDQPLVFKDNE